MLPSSLPSVLLTADKLGRILGHAADYLLLGLVAFILQGFLGMGVFSGIALLILGTIPGLLQARYAEPGMLALVMLFGTVSLVIAVTLTVFMASAAFFMTLDAFNGIIEFDKMLLDMLISVWFYWLAVRVVVSVAVQNHRQTRPADLLNEKR